VPEVRVIGGDGSQVGIIPTHEALRLAEEAGLDLVEVSPRAVPPVCRIMDFGRFKYQESKKEKASRKHQSTVVIKEIKFRPKTDTHDLDFKLKHIRRFLGEGNKVRLMIVFRGREIVHPETGQAMLDVVSKEVADISVIEQKPSMEGRRMVMVLGPRSGVIRPAIPTAAPAPAPISKSTLPAGGGQNPGAPRASSRNEFQRYPAGNACAQMRRGYTARLSCPS
jgi:translation initiation factor IF-3